MKLFNISLLAAIVAVVGLTGEANAQLFRRNNVNVVVNNGNAATQVEVRNRGLLFNRQSVTVRNVGGFHNVQAVEVRTPAYVNSQLLIQRQRLHQQRFFLNQLNTFTHTPYNNVANIRFINQGVHYYRTAQVVAAPIVQQYVLPPQVVDRQVAPQTQPDCGCEQTTAGDAQYLTQPQRVITRAYVTQPYYSQPVVVAQLNQRYYFRQGVQQRQFLSNCH